MDFKLTGLRIGREEGKTEGKKEGIEERNIEIAKAMLEENIAIEVITKCTGLTIEEINNLRD